MKTYSVYLNGKLTSTAATYVVANPANGSPVAQMCTVDRATVAQAIQDAHRAFVSWRKIPAKARGGDLRQILVEGTQRGGEIARLIKLENGKPLGPRQGGGGMTVD